MTLYSIQYQIGEQVGWHTASAASSEIAAEFVSNLYSDTYGNKAAILQCVESQPSNGVKYGVIPHRVAHRIETHKYHRHTKIVAWMTGELHSFVMDYPGHRDDLARREFAKKLHAEGCSSEGAIRIEYYYDAPAPADGVQYDCFAIVETNGNRRWFERGGRPASDDCHTLSRSKN